MAVVEIPIDPEFTLQTMRVVLDTETFVLRFTWNKRAATWSMDIMNTSEVLIAAGGKITPNWNPFRNIVQDGLPAGRFLAIDREGTDSMPAQLEFGLDRRIGLFYEEAA